MKAETITEQLKAIIIFQYLLKFNQMENLIKELFKNYLNQCSEETKNYMYFIYGSKLGTYIDYPNSTVKMSEHTFKKNETFSEFTIIQIMKLNKTYKVLPTFSDITSSKSKITAFDFQDSIIKLIETRNVLAHELSSPSFKDKHIIDILSDNEIEDLKYDFLNNYDRTKLDIETKTILSNYYYMDIIVKQLDYLTHNNE